MKNFIFIILIAILPACSTDAFGQRKSNSSPKRKLRLIVKPIQKPKIETEIWKEFESKDLTLKVFFPKEPTVTKNTYNEGIANVKSAIVQSYINQIFYMVEVREYPQGFLPKRTDLGENYGEWLKTFILNQNKVHNERTFDFGGYKMVEFVYQQTDNDILIHRVLVVGQNLYQQIIQLEIKKPETVEETIKKNKEKISKFFDSFVITGEMISDQAVG